jgi:hypothetical protein
VTTLIATSVVRGSRQGESHGGVYLIDVDQRRVAQPIDWNTMDIDWQGRGWDRGLRGIAFDGERVFIAASDELFVYAPDFRRLASWRNPFLKHCHEIFRWERRLYLTSTDFDSILGFDLDRNRFCFGMKIARDGDGFRGEPFNPESSSGPMPSNELHLNSVHCTPGGIYLAGLRTGWVLVYNGHEIHRWASLPHGAHNAQPFRDGVLFNDTQSDVVRHATAGGNQVFRVPSFPDAELTHTDLDDSRIARQSFGRGLCVLRDGLVAAGSSPSTVSLHDFDSMRTTLTVTLTMDVRNAIHGLEVWPYG